MKTAFNVILILFNIFGYSILFLFYLKVNKNIKMNENVIDNMYDDINSMKFKIELVKKKFETNAKRFSIIENDVDKIGAKLRKIDKDVRIEPLDSESKDDEV